MHPALTVAYGYNPQTNTFTGEVSAYLDQLASTSKKPVYTLPANATWARPPTDELPAFCCLEYRHDAWQLATDHEALSVEINLRIVESDAQINVLDDLISISNDDLKVSPDDTTLQAELNETKTTSLAWKRYRLALTRMAVSLSSLDVLALQWPERPVALGRGE